MKLKSIRYLLFLIPFIMVNVMHAQMFIPDFETPILLEKVNSQAEESMPLPYDNGDKLYFVRTYPEGSLKEKSKGQEIHSAERVDGVWREVNGNFKLLNDQGNNAVIGTSADGQTLYLFNSIHSRKRLAQGIAYIKKDSSGKWGKMREIDIPDFDLGLGHYSFHMNTDEDVLLISMSPNDTTIEEDLYVSLKGENGEWQSLINLGPTINSSGYEISPFLARDKKTLYFSSNGHEGMGDADVFVSYRIDDKWNNWTRPLNMGEPINSEAFDAYYIMGNEHEVFFTSNRNGGNSHIFSSKSTGDVEVGIRIIGQFKFSGLAAENTRLLVYDDEGNLTDEVVTDAYGNFSFFRLEDNPNYIIRIPATDIEQFPEGMVYVLNAEGQKLRRLLLDESGEFVSDTTYDDLILVKGVFTYNSLPVANSRLIVYDENGYPIDTILTDQYGKFKYERMALDQNITIRPMGGEDETGIVYFLDEKGKRKERFIVSGMESSYIAEDLKGIFKYRQLGRKKVKLVIYDENGFPIDTVITDEYGQFSYSRLKYDQNISILPLETSEGGLVYFTDEEGNKIARYIVNSDDPELTMRLFSGVFKFNQLAIANTTLVIYDQDGFPIDTVVTDAYGRFQFEKMALDKNISIKLLMEEDSGGLVYLSDDQGATVERYLVAGNGSFLERLKMEGSFTYNDLPLKNTTLVVYDANGFPVDTIVTDAYGNFTFEKLVLEDDFVLKPIDTEDFDGFVYVSDKNGNRIARFVITKDGKLLDGGVLLQREYIEGRFKHNKLPMGNVGLVLLDANGFPVDTFYTDEDGFFRYNKMKIDESFSIRPLGLDDDMSLEGAELYLKTDKIDRKDPSAKDLESGFTFNTRAKFTKAEDVNAPLSRGAYYDYSEDPNYSPQKNEDLVFYFDFNSSWIMADQARRIDKAGAKVQAARKITLIGHSDYVGSNSINFMFSKKRANAVYRYLLKRGFLSEEDQVNIVAHGERYPIASNENDIDRAKNRRVEIFIDN